MSADRRPASIGNLSLGIDNIPFRVYFAILVNVAERFTYYGLTIPFQNFVQNSYKSGDNERPGVLGLGQAAATAVSNGFFFFQTTMGIGGAIAADGWLGRYKLLVICSLTYMVGNLLLVVISTPVAIEHGAAPAGFAVALILLAIGLGGFQSTISAFIGDQYVEAGQGPITRKNGTVYMPDRDLTLQFVYNLNYWGLNLGSIAGIATTFLELDFGFWAAFLLPLCALWIAPTMLVLGRKAFICTTPKEDGLLKKSRAFSHLVKRRLRLLPKRSAQEAPGAGADAGRHEDMESVKQVLDICCVLLIFILVWVCVGQSMNNFITQAGQMQTNGLPNDLTWFANPILVVLLLPVVQWLLSTVLGRYRVRFGPMARITVGCIFLTLSMVYVSILQKLIYNAGPCHEFPTECSEADGGPNHISVWLQLPAYFLMAIAEILAITTGYKYAYDTAPDSLKSLVQAILLLTTGAGSLVCLAIAPTARNPHLVVMYACLAGSMFIATAIFATIYWKEDRIALEDTPINHSAISASEGPSEVQEKQRKL
ncbi:POT family-domain-containing protein [Xylariales sp. AK1849]|nr:POT family-domain-containing protein [Xylariales sp. AK1849]